MKVSIMKKLFFSAIVILSSQGCTSKVEIPIRHVGVVKNDEQLNAQVLKPGEHSVSFDSEVIIYDVNSENLEIEFDFLFSDSSEGNLKLAIEFNPIADSLPAFYRKYQSDYVTPIVDQGTRKVVRTLFLNHKPTDLTKNEFELKISKTIITDHPIMNYVNINKVDIVELRY
jgi:hypothetical protein